MSTRNQWPQLLLASALLVGLSGTAGAKKHGSVERLRSEIKMVVPPDCIEKAISLLGLANKPPASLEIAFIDTKDEVLAARDVIIRVRRRAGTPGESTVKIRVDSAAAASEDAELSIPPEYDWMGPNTQTVSRSLNHALPPEQLNQVVEGRATIDTLFSRRQQQMLSSTCPEFRWQNLVVFGPVQADVWDKQSMLPGFPKPVTIERWHLQKDGRKAEVLEVSVKVKTATQEEAKQLAADFYRAATRAGLGRAEGLSKTQIVVDFFRPTP